MTFSQAATWILQLGKCHLKSKQICGKSYQEAQATQSYRNERLVANGGSITRAP